MERLIEIALANATAACCLALLAAGVEIFCRRRPALTHGLWLLVLARLLMPPVLTPEVVLTTADRPTQAGTLTLSLPVSMVEPVAAMRAVDSAWPVSFPLGLWLSVSAALLALAGYRTWRLRHRLTEAEPVSRELAARWFELADRLAIASPPALYRVGERISPMLFSIVGWARVVLPKGLWRDLSDHEQDALLLHELAHWKRRDHWVRHLELAALILFWWHPAVWLASWRLRRAEELACDALVAETLPNHRRAYAEALLETAKFLAGGRCVTPTLATGVRVANNLKGRIEMIFDRNRPQRTSTAGRLALATAVVLALALTPVFTASTQPAEGYSAASYSADSYSTESEFRGAPIDLEFRNVELTQPLRKLAQVSGLNFVVDPATAVDMKVTTQLESIPWDQALHYLLKINHLDYSIEGNVLWVHARDRRRTESPLYDGEPIDLKLFYADLRQVLADFGRYTDLEIALDEGIAGTVSLELAAVPWDQALDIILQLNELEAIAENGKLWIQASC
ncbi:MAG: M56 family metallopeptidase [Acidobacteriota bacterium]